MYKNYLKIAIRNLGKSKIFSLINISGMAVGMAACILIMFWVFDELTFDQFYPNADRIHQINKSFLMGAVSDYNQSTPLLLAGTLRKDFSEVEKATFFRGTNALVSYKDKRFSENQICRSDSSFFDVLAFEFIRVDSRTAFQNPNSVVITEAIAEKYFGTENPVGKVLNFDNARDYVVSGVLKNIPLNSTHRFDIYIRTPQQEIDNRSNDWETHFVRTTVLLHKNADISVFNQKLDKLAKEHLPEEKISFLTQPLSKIHLYSIDGRPEGMKYIYFFSVIALFILIIACINFMNLSTARSIKRAREIGMRKVIGAEKKQIIGQFLGESVINALVALIFALVIVELIRPAFNNLTGKAIAIDYHNLKIIGLFLLTAVITGLFAGLYPALFLSAFQPVKILKSSSINSGNSRLSMRKILVVTQFAIAILLLTSTSIIYLQNNYMRNKELGFKKDNIVYVQLNDNILKNFDAMRNELIRHSDINNVTRTSELPTNVFMIARGITWKGKATQKGVAFGCAAVDFEYINTLNLQIIKGRALSLDFPSDSGSVLINEKAAAMIGWEDPIGKNLFFDPENSLSVVGVVKDFNALPLTMEIEPMMLLIYPAFYRYMLIDVNSTNTPETIAKIEKVWQQFSPAFPFEYHFLDEQFEQDYRTEIRMSKIFAYFVVLAIFISCLGLFGLAAFTAQQRRKEIGIRKVHGATIGGLVFLLSREFAKLVLIANIFAWPLAWYAMHKWLQHFAYRTEITVWPFLFSGILTLLIALLTVSFHTINAALANPVKSLRYE